MIVVDDPKRVIARTKRCRIDLDLLRVGYEARHPDLIRSTIEDYPGLGSVSGRKTRPTATGIAQGTAHGVDSSVDWVGLEVTWKIAAACPL